MCGPLIPLACAELGWGMMGIALECSGCPGWRTSELQERDNHPARWPQAYRATPLPVWGGASPGRPSWAGCPLAKGKLQPWSSVKNSSLKK